MAGLGRKLSLREVAELVGGRVVGDERRRVQRLSPLDTAGPSDLSLLAHPRYREQALGSSAGAFLVKEGFEVEGRDQVVVKDPHLGLTALLPVLHPAPPAPSGISSSAFISPEARIGDGAAVGPFAVIEPRAVIGKGAVVSAGCYVGEACEIGEGVVLHPNTTVYRGCTLGKRVIVHSGTVIGSDGFGYATSGGEHRKIPQVGSVVIEDDVEIGACVTIDRGSIGTTFVGRGTKIDNLVQIGHNVRIGSGCLIVAQVGISGSTKIGPGTVFAGQSGAAGHLTIGSQAVVASKSAVYGDLPDKAFVAGIPAMDHRVWKRAQAVYARLPEMRRQVLALEERVAAVEARDRGVLVRRSRAAGTTARRGAARKGKRT